MDRQTIILHVLGQIVSKYDFYFEGIIQVSSYYSFTQIHNNKALIDLYTEDGYIQIVDIKTQDM